MFHCSVRRRRRRRWQWTLRWRRVLAKISANFFLFFHFFFPSSFSALTHSLCAWFTSLQCYYFLLWSHCLHEVVALLNVVLWVPLRQKLAVSVHTTDRVCAQCRHSYIFVSQAGRVCLSVRPSIHPPHPKNSAISQTNKQITSKVASFVHSCHPWIQSHVSIRSSVRFVFHQLTAHQKVITSPWSSIFATEYSQHTKGYKICNVSHRIPSWIPISPWRKWMKRNSMKQYYNFHQGFCKLLKFDSISSKWTRKVSLVLISDWDDYYHFDEPLQSLPREPWLQTYIVSQWFDIVLQLRCWCAISLHAYTLE